MLLLLLLLNIMNDYCIDHPLNLNFNSYMLKFLFVLITCSVLCFSFSQSFCQKQHPPNVYICLIIYLLRTLHLFKQNNKKKITSSYIMKTITQNYFVYPAMHVEDIHLCSFCSFVQNLVSKVSNFERLLTLVLYSFFTFYYFFLYILQIFTRSIIVEDTLHSYIHIQFFWLYVYLPISVVNIFCTVFIVCNLFYLCFISISTLGSRKII